MKSVKINGETREWRRQTVAELVAAEGVAEGVGGVAVALNAAVVPRQVWAKTEVEPDDTIEIVRVVRGG